MSKGRGKLITGHLKGKSLTFRSRRPLRHRTNHAPQSLARSIRSLVPSAVQCDSFLLAQDHVHGVHQFALHVDYIRLGHGTNKVRHIGVGIVDGSESGQDCHDRHSDNADPRHSLFQREYPLVDAKQGKGIPDPPETVEIEQPEARREVFYIFLRHCSGTSQDQVISRIQGICMRVRTKSDVGNARVGYVVWNQRDHHDQKQAQAESPMKISRAGIEETGNLEDD